MDRSEEETKQGLIMEYAIKKGKEHNLNDEIIKEIIVEVIESPKTLEEIKEEIDMLIAKYKKELAEKGEVISEEMRPKESTSRYETSPSGSMIITPQPEKKESTSIYSTSPSGSMVITPQPEKKESTSIYSTSPSGSMVITPQPEKKESTSIYETSPSGSMIITPQPEKKESTSIYSTSPSGSMVITPKPKDDSINELQEMMKSDESKKIEPSPMSKENPSKAMVKTNNNGNKGYASTMSIASSLGIIIGIIFLLLLLLLLI